MYQNSVKKTPVFHFMINNLKLPLPMDALYQVWLKSVHFFQISSIIFDFLNIISPWKGACPFKDTLCQL